MDDNYLNLQTFRLLSLVICTCIVNLPFLLFEVFFFIIMIFDWMYEAIPEELIYCMLFVLWLHFKINLMISLEMASILMIYYGINVGTLMSGDRWIIMILVNLLGISKTLLMLSLSTCLANIIHYHSKKAKMAPYFYITYKLQILYQVYMFS